MKIILEHALSDPKVLTLEEARRLYEELREIFDPAAKIQRGFVAPQQAIQQQSSSFWPPLENVTVTYGVNIPESTRMI